MNKTLLALIVATAAAVALPATASAGGPHVKVFDGNTGGTAVADEIIMQFGEIKTRHETAKNRIGNIR